MKTILSSAYTLTLALWVGGMALFTFIVTPVIFRSFGRDAASGIVGHLFPGYFFYNLILAAAALALFFLLPIDRATSSSRFSLVLLSAALVVNLFIVFKLHPEAVAVKQEIASFEREARDSPVRKKFSRLHALSMALNLFLLADGIALLIAAPVAKK
jgi:uncharacterized membrane protein